MSQESGCCQCSSYPDLALDESEIIARIKQYKEMRASLKQVAQKVVERYVVHYRLYVCEACGQHWQAALATVGFDESFYLYRVPKIEKREWLQKPFVCPSSIVSYWKAMNRYLAQPFERKQQPCAVNSCENFAIEASLECLGHHIESLVEAGILPQKPNGRWFWPYRDGATAAQQVLQADRPAFGGPAA